jgi:hypothetical protein
MTRASAALLAATAFSAALAGCSSKAASPAPQAPTPKTLTMSGGSAEVSVLSWFEGTAEHPQLNIPGYTERVMWLQVAFRFLTQPTSPVLDRSWFLLQDGDGRADPRITHLGPDAQAGNPDPDHPVLDPRTTLAKGETVAGFLAFPPAELVFTPSSIVFHPPDGEQVSWPLAGLPGAPVDNPVTFPPDGEGAVPGQSSVVRGRQYANAEKAALVPTTLHVTFTDLRNRPDRVAAMPRHRVEQFTVTVTNQGGAPVYVDPAAAVTAVDTQGHWFRTAGLDQNELSAGTVPPGGSRTGDVIVPVPEHAVLDHLRFALAVPGATGVTWWRLR